MEYRVLGTLEVLDSTGEVIDLRGPKLRRLLAVLLVRAGQPVPADALADVLWGEHPPTGADNALQAQVSKLRKLLPDANLRTRDGAYQLDVDDEAVDSRRFVRAVTAGADLLDDGRALDAVARLRDALGLWRGPAFADFGDDDFATAERVRLDELHISAIELCVDAELAAGRHDSLVAELESLVGQYPLRERLWEQLMLALYRAGRQSDALRAFQRARQVLAEELGLDPGPALRELESRILAQDVTIAPPVARQPRTRLSNIHPELTGFVGRANELADIDAILADRRLVTITGPGGVGKTRIATEIALRSEQRWRDGTWLVELGPEAGAGGVVRSLVRTFGPRLGRTATDEGIEWLIDGLAATELLIVVDNCEHLVAETKTVVSALLRACPHVRVLATSREPLGVAGEVVRRLAPLDAADAVALFAMRAADASDTFILDEESSPAVEAICAHVDRLPLAIELTAARTRAFSAGQLAELLDNRFRVVAIDSTVEWSFNLLFEDERRLLTRLCVFTGGFSLDGAIAVCADEFVANEDVGLLLARLVDKSLVVAAPSGEHGARFRLLRPVEEFCAARLDEAGETALMHSRHARWVAALTHGLTAGLRSASMLEWSRRTSGELANITRAAQWCRTEGDAADGLKIVVNLGWYAFLSANVPTDEPVLVDLLDRPGDVPLDLRCRAMMWAGLLSIGRTGARTWAMDAIDVARTAAGTAATTGDAATRQVLTLDGVALSNAAIDLARTTGDQQLLLETLTIGSLHLVAIGSLPSTVLTLNAEARALASALGDRWSTAFVIALDGMASYVAGDLPRALDELDSAVTALRAENDEGTAALFEVSRSEVAELVGDIALATRAMQAAYDVGTSARFPVTVVLQAVLCWLLGRNGETDRALTIGRELEAIAHPPFNPVIRAQALFALGVAEHLAGDDTSALTALGEALAIHRQVGMVREEAMDHRHLGEIFRTQGALAEALEHGRRSIQRAIEVGLPWTVMLCARTLATSLVAGGDYEPACVLIGAAAGVSDTFGYPPTPAEQSEIEIVETAARAAIGDARVAALMAVGSTTHYADITRVLAGG